MLFSQNQAASVATHFGEIYSAIAIRKVNSQDRIVEVSCALYEQQRYLPVQGLD